MLTKLKHPVKRAFNRFVDWLTVTRLGIGFLTFSLFISVAGYIHMHPGGFDLGALLDDYGANAATEAASIALTILIIDNIYRRRQTQSDKKRLLRLIASRYNVIVLQAVDELKMNDGTLRGARLWDADLQEAEIPHADLQEAKLWRANLRGTGLWHANLANAYMHDAFLVGAKLQHADLSGADLQDANLENADLYTADLEGACLQGANLKGAHLHDANLKAVRFDEDTVLPDGTRWKAGTDLSRFIHPNHANHAH
jgi:uncharacterized protein YjbI with pentapeptide repeats